MSKMMKKFPLPKNFQAVTASLALSVIASCGYANPPEKDDISASELKAANQQPSETITKDGRKVIPLSEVKTMTKEEQISFAREDFANKMNLALDEVQLSGWTPVTWRSGALGCPKSGEQYTQALVPGVLIMLRVGNTPYRYHAIPKGEPFYCPDDMAEPPYINSSDA